MAINSRLTALVYLPDPLKAHRCIQPVRGLRLKQRKDVLPPPLSGRSILPHATEEEVFELSVSACARDISVILIMRANTTPRCNRFAFSLPPPQLRLRSACKCRDAFPSSSASQQRGRDSDAPGPEAPSSRQRSAASRPRPRAPYIAYCRGKRRMRAEAYGASEGRGRKSTGLD